MRLLDILARKAKARAAAMNDEHEGKTWEEMLIDSAIIGGISFFSALIVEGLPTPETFYSAAIAFGLAFCIQLSVERGLKRPNS